MALTLEPEEEDLGFSGGIGVKVCIADAADAGDVAEFGDFTEFDDWDGVCCAFTAAGTARVIAMAMAVSLMIFPRDLMASSEFP
ncbi:MAG: hypothetical protein ABSF43_04370 [Rectinemataceae bacterium]